MYGFLALIATWFLRMTIINGMSSGRITSGLWASLAHGLLSAVLFAFSGVLLFAPFIETESSRALFLLLVACFASFTYLGYRRASDQRQAILDTQDWRSRT
ncbi:hypothetical protein [Salicola sp. Rm-C-2C1-2]|uniref:hypothetical protein n=1 Tax=Salicola sp. Rm-C-2C1-2 TaxID=3141321 RepID=UPI0032E3CAF7